MSSVAHIHPLLPLERADSSAAAPVLKWAGGKTRLLPELVSRLPARSRRYYEPFVGGGALYLALAPRGAVLSDVNAELINLYTVIRDHVDALVDDLQRHRYERDYYYEVRAADTSRMTPVQRASRVIFLNRTCFNGLYRVNRKGHFNVPFGRYSNPTICQTERLLAVSDVLSDATLLHAGYREATATARAGDFVYFDPPYVPLTRTASFTSYTKDAFGPDDQADLAALFDELADRGVQCMLSNSDTPLVRELYGHHHVATVETTRPIARDPDSRGTVTEVVVTSYRP